MTGYRSPLRWLALAALAAAALPAAAHGAVPAKALTPSRCPAALTASGAPGIPPAAGPLVFGGVAAMRLCRYGPYGPTTLPARGLQAQRLLRGGSPIGGLVRQLNALAPVPAGPTACPAETGAEVLILARYRGGATAKVTVQLSGCRIVTRGHVARSAEFSPGGAALLAELVRLTP